MYQNTYKHGTLALSFSHYRASDFTFQKKQFSVSKKVKFRFNSVSLLVTLNSMKSQYIERKCGERTVKWHNYCGELKKKGTINAVNGRKEEKGHY